MRVKLPHAASPALILHDGGSSDCKIPKVITLRVVNPLALAAVDCFPGFHPLIVIVVKRLANSCLFHLFNLCPVTSLLHSKPAFTIKQFALFSPFVSCLRLLPSTLSSSCAVCSSPTESKHHSILPWTCLFLKKSVFSLLAPTRKVDFSLRSARLTGQHYFTR